MTVSAAHGKRVALGDAQDPLSPVLCHLNSVGTSLRLTAAESLIMRSNGMSWELCPLSQDCLIILSQPPVSLQSLIPANHAPRKGMGTMTGN